MNSNEDVQIQPSKLAKIFPYIPNKMDQLKIDDESLTFITYKDDSTKITRILKRYLFKQNIRESDCTIVDATAGVGGNVISFCKSFKYVIAYEINEERAKFLENNLELYGINNVKVIHDDCMKYMFNEPCDVLFIDPPWGGINYKKKKRLRLTLGDESIEDVCKKMVDKCKLIGLKLPKNYDIKHLFDSFDQSVLLYMHTLERMNIIIIVPKSVT
jgi:16S rRNA G966 N2-methylase RsmD